MTLLRGPHRSRSGSAFTRGRGTLASPSTAYADAEPDWDALERVIADLAGSQAPFATSISATTRITLYHPGKRLMLENDGRTSWVQIENLRACWDTFERLGRITRHDVLEPGRCSALVMGLFSQVPGVLREDGDEVELVLPNAAAG